MQRNHRLIARPVALTAALTAALIASTPLATAAESTIEPGWYEVVTKVDAGAPATDHRCVTSAEIAQGLKPEGLAKDCKVTRSVLGGGRLDFAATCPDMTMTLAGTYAATSYVMDSKLRLTVNGKPVESASHVTAKKVAATCRSE